MTTSLHVVDSCGWLEYFRGGPNAAFFQTALWDTEHLLVPALSLFEVCRRVLQLSGPDAAQRVYKAMSVPRVVQLEPGEWFAISQRAGSLGLAMGDAIIWHTAQVHGATLWTQDAGLQHLPGVRFQPAGKVGA